MANYNYPKTFCNCSIKSELNMNNGIPSNISIANCGKYSDFNNMNLIQFKENTIQPCTKNGYEYYNTLHYSNDFEKIGPNQYYSPDPRLYDTNRNIRTTLNIPPLSSSVRLKDVYDINVNYGVGYNTYSDVNAPKKTKSAYMYFCEDRRNSIKEKNPEIKPTDIMKLLGSEWKEIKNKTKYEKLSAEE